MMLKLVDYTKSGQALYSEVHGIDPVTPGQIIEQIRRQAARYALRLREDDINIKGTPKSRREILSGSSE